ncbi:hypothetical protein ACWEHA_34240 [Amycolatopsis nivea]
MRCRRAWQGKARPFWALGGPRERGPLVAFFAAEVLLSAVLGVPWAWATPAWLLGYWRSRDGDWQTS